MPNHNIMVQRLSRLITLATLLMCASCGWQLQGVHHVSENLQPLCVQYADIHSSFSRALQDRLRASGVEVIADDTQAKAILQITKEDSGHRVISVTATNIPAEYDVYYTVEFVIKAKSGEMLLQQPLHGSQTMTYDETRALAKQREERLLSDTMAAELADQLLRQIRRL